MTALVTGLAMGLVGTAAMDIWARALHHGAGHSLPNWAMPGRWLGHVARGRIFHDDIGAAARVPGERGLGWALHYGVGVVYGVLWAVVAGPGWLAAPTFVPVWLFALATIAAGWFLLMPGMGLGWAGARLERPWVARGLGLAAHTAFGLGMWGAAVTLA